MNRYPRRVALKSALTTLAWCMGPSWFLACGSDSSSKGAAGTGGTSGVGGAGGSGGGIGTGASGGTGGNVSASGGAPAGGSPQAAAGTPNAGANTAGVAGGSGTLSSRIHLLGPLQAPDANGLRLPVGFTSRVVAETGKQPVTSSDYVWHGAPDGGAVYALPDGGWVYVSNAELDGEAGGVGALRFNAGGALVDAYPILSNTARNCAGGWTPWQTWLSCEEVDRGRVFECDPLGLKAAVARPALGIFKHEAAAVDPIRGHIYLTEDEGDGCLYRFVPSQMTLMGLPDLTQGQLEVAEVNEAGNIIWHALPDPQYAQATPTRQQIAASTKFDGGEGVWYFEGVIYFSTKGDNRVWAYDIAQNRLSILYDRATSLNPILSGVDNVTVSCCGDVLVAEDGGDMEIVAITADGQVRPLLQVTGHDESEITGPAFDPSGTRLYFSSQRGASGSSSAGVTYEVTGPFHS